MQMTGILGKLQAKVHCPPLLPQRLSIKGPVMLLEVVQ